LFFDATISDELKFAKILLKCFMRI